MSCLKQLDLIAPRVEITYREQRRQGTVLGGACSLIISLIILYYTASEVYRIESSFNFSLTQNKQWFLVHENTTLPNAENN